MEYKMTQWHSRLAIFSVVWIIVTSGGVFLNTENIVNFRLLADVFLVVVQLLLSWKILIGTRVDQVLIYLVAFLLTVLTIISNSDYDSILTYVRFLLVLAVALGTSLIVDSYDLAEIFVKTVVTLAAVSLVFFYGDFLSDGSQFFQVIKFHDNQYINAFLYLHRFGLESRNLSIFIEPGIFQLYINFAFYLVLNSKKYIKNKWIVISVLIVALYSTNSTTGYIMGLFIFATNIFSSTKKNNEFFVPLLKYAIYFGVIIFVIFSEVFLINMEDKFVGTEQQSYETRKNSPLIDITIMYDNPIFGGGVGGYLESVYRYSYGGVTVDAATNTFTQLAAFFGIPMLMLFLWRIYSYVINLNIGGVNSFTILVLYLVLFSVQPFVLHPIFYLPIFMCSNKQVRRSSLRILGKVHQ